MLTNSKIFRRVIGVYFSKSLILVFSIILEVLINISSSQKMLYVFFSYRNISNSLTEILTNSLVHHVLSSTELILKF